MGSNNVEGVVMVSVPEPMKWMDSVCDRCLDLIIRLVFDGFSKILEQ
jgi:hypothetical protein